MAVRLADRALTVVKRAHPWVRDGRGVPMPTAADDLTTVDPTPGAAAVNPDGTWTLRVDPAAWELRAGDQISDDQGNEWVVTGVPVLNALPGGTGAIDFIACTATLEPPK